MPSLWKHHVLSARLIDLLRALNLLCILRDCWNWKCALEYSSSCTFKGLHDLISSCILSSFLVILKRGNAISSCSKILLIPASERRSTHKHGYVEDFLKRSKGVVQAKYSVVHYKRRAESLMFHMDSFPLWLCSTEDSVL